MGLVIDPSVTYSREPSSGCDERRSPPRVAAAIRQAQSGDREAFGFLYARYADDVYRYVRSLVCDQHEAEDVTQQVFAKLMRTIGRYEEREVPFFAWVVRIARNQAIDHMRARRLIPVEEVRASDGGAGDPAAFRPLGDLCEALAELPQDQREVVVLRHLAGLSPSEVADRTGRSEASVHGLHHRGRRSLKAALAGRGAAPSTMDRALGTTRPVT